MSSIRTWATALALSVLLLPFSTLAKSITGDRILIVHDAELDKSAYSKFWSSLQGRGYKLTYRTSKDTKTPLTSFEAPNYDHVVFFAPTAKTFSADLSPSSVVKFLSQPDDASSQGGNILFVFTPSVPAYIRELAREFHVEIDEKDSTVVDHFNSVSALDDGTHTAVSVPSTNVDWAGLATPAKEVSALKRGALAFKGIAHTISHHPLVRPIALASETAFAAKSSKKAADDVFASGESIALASALQARNNARVAFVGSVELFSDKFAEASSGNEPFIEQLTKWTFQEQGVLKVVDIVHHRDTELPSPQAPEQYRVGEDITYAIELSLYENDLWRPFNSADDLQLEFTMLDPHLRIPLLPVSSSPSSSPSAISTTPSTRYAASFRVPDRHGVFTFFVDYRRTGTFGGNGRPNGAGTSYVLAKRQVSVVPPRHDEYDRFIVGAWPWYAGAGSVSAAFLLFAGLWMRVEAAAKA